MKATGNNPQRLESLRINRDAIRVRTAPLTARFAEIERRDAFLALWANAKAKPEAIHDIQRGRTNVPGERGRALVHQGIRDGYITREQVLAYRLSQTADDLAQFPNARTPQEVHFVQCVVEFAEAMDALTRAHGMPTRENLARASKETREALVIGELHLTAIERGLSA